MISSKHLKLLQNITALLDSQFKFGPVTFGIDPLFGLIPFIGDLIPTLFSVYLILMAIINKLPRSVIMSMAFYTAIDFLFGSMPVIGDIIDFFFKSHTKNFQLLKQHLGK